MLILARYVKNVWSEHLCPIGQGSLHLSVFSVWYNLMGHNNIVCNITSGDCWYEAVDVGCIFWMSVHICFVIGVLLSNLHYFNTFWYQQYCIIVVCHKNYLDIYFDAFTNIIIIVTCATVGCTYISKIMLVMYLTWALYHCIKCTFDFDVLYMS